MGSIPIICSIQLYIKLNELNYIKTKSINAKSFFTSIAIIFILMLFSYVLTFILPGGEYTRYVTQSGNTMVDVSVPFKVVDSGMPFWKWVLAPLLVLGSDTGSTLIIVIAFLFIIGGVFRSFRLYGLNEYLLNKIVYIYGNNKYKLMYVLILFFMCIGSFAGTFEAVIPIVPIVVSLSIVLGWNGVLGLAISLLSVECGFAVGIMNSFTVGVAQTLSGIQMFSGAWLRIISFVLIYILLSIFLTRCAKRLDKCSIEQSIAKFEIDTRMDKALKFFLISILLGIVCILSFSLISSLRKYTMILIVITFFIAGVGAVKIAGMKLDDFIKTFFDGVISMIPCVVVILMASSIKYILTESNIMDTILHGAVSIADGMPNELLIIFIYCLCLFINFFIPSGTAKAFLLIPLIVPLAQIFGISAQLCVLAYAFGDGFSNVVYPTNPGLLISLGLSDISYIDWIKFSWKFHLINFILTSLILEFGLMVGYC